MQWRIQEYLKGGHYRGGSRIDCRGGLSIPRALARAKFYVLRPCTFYVIFKVPAGHTASVGINKRETQQRLTIICATPTFDVIFKVPAGHTASVGISIHVETFRTFTARRTA